MTPVGSTKQNPLIVPLSLIESAFKNGLIRRVDYDRVKIYEEPIKVEGFWVVINKYIGIVVPETAENLIKLVDEINIDIGHDL